MFSTIRFTRETIEDGCWYRDEPITFPFIVCVANYFIILWILTNLAIAEWVCGTYCLNKLFI
jgi:hypothetical protein